ncbi:MAG: YfhO family protein [Peptococcaceae bacterium]|jgi:uncharacterized membrane protein YfhO|nr:YfhO family protein [Peptococcaceae bacterium]
MDVLKRNRFLILSFFTPIVLLGAAFAKIGVYPFGDNSIMIIDNFHQYTPFLMEFGEMLRNGRSLMFSWEAGLGTNFLARYAYYLSSPLNFLAVFFPAKWTHEFLLGLVFLRCGASGAAFFVYLKYKFKSADYKTAAFAVMYALPAFLLAYYWNVMWFDCIALFPLAALGIEKIVNEDRYAFYCVVLGLIIICNFYIALIVCLFSFFFFLNCLLSGPFPESFRPWGLKFLKFLLFSGLAGALSAVVTLPAFFGLLNSSAAGAAFPENIRFYSNMLDIIENHLMLVTPSITVGLPNVYCGVAVWILIPLYWINPGISGKEKACKISLLALMLVSFNINYLDFLWHGMHFPNSLFFRFAFLYVFLLLSVAYETLTKLDRIPGERILTVLGLAVLMIFVMEKLPSENIQPHVIYASVLFVLIYGVLAYAMVKLPAGRTAWALILFLAVSAEIGFNAAGGIGQAGVYPRDNYLAKRDEVLPAVRQAESLETGFERMEFTSQTTYNTPVVYGYKGISYYSSTSYSDLNRLMEKMGMIGSSAWYVYRSSTPVFNSLFSIKRLLSRNDEFEGHIYEETDRVGEVRIFDNPYYLPVGFMVREDVVDWDCKNNDPFAVQQDFLEKAAGQGQAVFEPLRITPDTLSNMEITNQSDRGEYWYSRLQSGQSVKAGFTVTPAESGPVYLYVRSSKIQQLRVYRGESVETHSIKYPYIIDAKVVRGGESVRFEVDLDDADTGMFYMYAYRFNEAAYRPVYEQLRSQGLDVTSYTDTGLEGRVRADHPGILFTSVGYDDGWTVRVDGEKVRAISLGDGALLALELPAGDHEIQFRYRTRGLIPGAVITLAAAAGLFFLSWRGRKQKRFVGAGE